MSPVAAVVGQRDEAGASQFEVRVLDGRHFVLRYRVEFEEWELVAIRGRGQKRQFTRVVANPLLMPLLKALCRKGLEMARDTLSTSSGNARPPRATAG